MASTLVAKNPPAQTPERKRKRPSAESPEVKKKKVHKSSAPLARSPPAKPKKEPLPFQRTWTPDDEVRILEALAAHREDHGKLPNSKVLFASLDGRLDKKGFGRRELREKVCNLKRRHDNDTNKGIPAKEHECRLYHLSKNVWGDMSHPVTTSGGGGGAKVPNAAKTFDEMRQLYPSLAHEVMLIVDEPAVLERVLPSIDDSKAQALDSKINMLRKELTNAIAESARMQSIEVPKVWQYQCPFTNLEPAKSSAENDNIFLLERLDKIDGASIGAQEQLTRVEHQILELKQIFIASRSSPKDIRCESAESAPQSVVAENQFSRNILQRKIAAQNKLPHGKNKEVTSKYRFPRNISRRMVLAPKSMPHDKKEKIDAESQIHHDVEQRKVAACAQHGFSHNRNEEGGKEVILLSYVWPHLPVAKATLQTSSPSAIVGGMALGPGCCQVFVNGVLNGKAPLIRPYGNMNKMADALECSIAWTCDKIRHGGIAGMISPDQPSRPDQ